MLRCSSCGGVFLTSHLMGEGSMKKSEKKKGEK
jgi:hypothetical protein